MLKTFVTAACLAGIGSAAMAQDESLSWGVLEVVPGILMLEGQGGFTGGNLGLIVGDDGVVLIDDGLQGIAATTVAAVEDLIDEPISFLINTHAHGDHTGANADFHIRGATVVAQDNVRATLAADRAFPAAGLPELTFSEALTFHLNGRRAYLFHIPKAHTSGDAAIYFPDDNVIHTGDLLFNRIFPFIDLDSGGSVDGFIAGQKKLLDMADDETRIIPGHGPLATRADLQVALDMLTDARSRVRALVDAGKSLDEIKAENPLSIYDDWSWAFVTTEGMTETLYRSLTE